MLTHVWRRSAKTSDDTVVTYQDLVVRPWVVIRPIVQLLIDPRQQGDRAVVQSVAKCLWLGALLDTVSTAFVHEPCASQEQRC